LRQANPACRYNLSRRIHDVKTYPVQTPQGATVLIYAHENGLTLVWRGGKRLKPAKQAANNSKQNGTNSTDVVMIIDSDDEGQQQPPPAFQDKPEFEDIRPEDSSSFPEIIQTLDLSLGTAALHIAVLPMAPATPDVAGSSGPAILGDRMVFAVSCATAQVYLITIPLTPPSEQSKARPELKKDLLAGNAGRGTWGETLTILGGQSRHSDGLAMSLVSSNQKERSRSRDRSGQQPDTRARVIVASHNMEASGTLRFWEVSLDAKPGKNAQVKPFQTEYLPAPLTGISFNPSHTTQLLTIASPHAVRIYDYSQRSIEEDASEEAYPTQGSWLLSLYPPFSRGPSMSTSRKPIIAADWIAHGRAVLTLLADGQWGIWDIDGAGPLSSGSGGPGLFGKASASLRGAALTTFSVTGYLEGTSPLRNPAAQKSASVPGSGNDFVPMTPHTRRDALVASMTGGAEKLATVKGGIEVVRAQALRAASATGHTDETAVLWMGSADPVVAIIPSVSRFWEAQMRRGGGGGVNLFSGAQPTRMIRLTDLSAGLLGERCTGIGAVPRPAKQRRDSSTPSNGSTPEPGSSSSAEGLPVDVLIQGESRLVIVRESADGTPLTNRLLTLHKKKRLASTNAIIAYPRPEKPSSVAFNLTSQRGASLARSIRPQARPAVKGLFEPQPRPSGSGLFDQAPYLPQAHNTFTNLEPSTSGPSQRGAGLLFTQSLYSAADASANESEVEERDVEEEMLDIMEIDRELEEMEVERESGQQKNLFSFDNISDSA
jgi:hypothetical protein